MARSRGRGDAVRRRAGPQRALQGEQVGAPRQVDAPLRPAVRGQLPGPGGDQPERRPRRGAGRPSTAAPLAAQHQQLRLALPGAGCPRRSKIRSARRASRRARSASPSTSAHSARTSSVSPTSCARPARPKLLGGPGQQQLGVADQAGLAQHPGPVQQPDRVQVAAQRVLGLLHRGQRPRACRPARKSAYPRLCRAFHIEHLVPGSPRRPATHSSKSADAASSEPMSRCSTPRFSRIAITSYGVGVRAITSAARSKAAQRLAAAAAAQQQQPALAADGGQQRLGAGERRHASASASSAIAASEPSGDLELGGGQPEHHPDALRRHLDRAGSPERSMPAAQRAGTGSRARAGRPCCGLLPGPPRPRRASASGSRGWPPAESTAGTGVSRPHSRASLVAERVEAQLAEALGEAVEAEPALLVGDHLALAAALDPQPDPARLRRREPAVEPQPAGPDPADA